MVNYTLPLVYLYDHQVTVYIDHLAVQAILNTPTPSEKHARWWSKVYGSGISEVSIVYHSGRTNTNADALSCNPYLPAPQEGIREGELQVAAVSSEPEASISALLQANPGPSVSTPFGEEQKKDAKLREVIQFLKTEELPTDSKRAKKTVSQQSLFAIMDDVLYYIDH